MWGNRLGWIISSGMIVLTAVILLMLTRMDTISSPSNFGRNASNFGPLPPIGDVSAVMTFDQPGDAGPLYKRAISAHASNERLFRNFLEARTPKLEKATLNSMAGAFDALKSASKMQSMTLFAAEPAEVINYDSTKGPLPRLKTVGEAAILAALHLRTEDPQEANALAEAVFSLGYKLFNERVTWQECWAGVELMSKAAAEMSRVAEKAKNTERVAQIATFTASKNAFVEATTPTVRALTTPDAKVMGQYVGDIFVIAESSPERMWRVEAIRKLGVIRYARIAGKRKGDQLGALRAAKKYAEDPDKVIATAGKVASELTLAEFNLYR